MQQPCRPCMFQRNTPVLSILGNTIAARQVLATLVEAPLKHPCLTCKHREASDCRNCSTENRPSVVDGGCRPASCCIAASAPSHQARRPWRWLAAATSLARSGGDLRITCCCESWPAPFCIKASARQHRLQQRAAITSDLSRAHSIGGGGGVRIIGGG